MKKDTDFSTDVIYAYRINSRYYCKGCKWHKNKECKKKRVVRICRKERLKNV